MRRRTLVLGGAGALVAIGAIGAVVGGKTNAGQIVFGTTIDAGNFKVAAPVTTVKEGTALGWVAYLNDSVKGTSVTVTLALANAGAAESTVASQTVSIADPEWNQLAHTPDQAVSGESPGTYRVRYVRPSDGTLLAEGTIVVSP